LWVEAPIGGRLDNSATGGGGDEEDEEQDSDDKPEDAPQEVSAMPEHPDPPSKALDGPLSVWWLPAVLILCLFLESIPESIGMVLHFIAFGAEEPENKPCHKDDDEDHHDAAPPKENAHKSLLRCLRLHKKRRLSL